MSLIAVMLAFVGREPIGICLAASFCLASWFGISFLGALTARHLFKTVGAAVGQRSLGILSRRYRWVYLDGLIVVWTLISIAVANFVLENSVSNARYLVLYCWVLGPIATIAYYACRKATRDKSD